MRRRNYSCALIALFAAFAAVGQSRADVTYSYFAEQNSYIGTAGSTVSVNLFLKETVTNTGTNTTSLIQRVFATPDLSNLFQGVAQIGVGVEQTGVSGSVSQILGGSVYNNTGTYPGVVNNPGWTFAPDFTYSFKVNNINKLGGSSLAQLYMNQTATDGTASGNNMQVTAALSGANSNTGFNATSGQVTDAAFDSVNDRYGTGKILIGTLNITVATGTTTFQVKPLAQTNLVGNGSTQFNGGAATAANSGVATPISGANGATQTNLAVTIFGNGTSGVISLDTSYTTASRQPSATFDTYNSVNDFAVIFGGNGKGPAAGPSHVPPTSSFLPFYTADSSPFTFTVGTAVVPEPSSMALCGLITAAGAAYAAKRRRKTQAAV